MDGEMEGWSIDSTTIPDTSDRKAADPQDREADSLEGLWMRKTLRRRSIRRQKWLTITQD